jgi:uncharacterized protein (DUF433 family)
MTPLPRIKRELLPEVGPLWYTLDEFPACREGHPRTMRSNVIHSDPEIMGGVPVFIGTRVPVGVLFENLVAGASLDEILENFPSLRREQAVEAIREATTIIEQSAMG